MTDTLNNNFEQLQNARMAVDRLESFRTPRERTLYERSAIESAEVKLLNLEQIEKMLKEQLEMTHEELQGVQRVVKAQRALIEVLRNGEGE